MYRCSAANEEVRFGFRKRSEPNFRVNLLKLKIDQFTDSEGIA